MASVNTDRPKGIWPTSTLVEGGGAYVCVALARLPMMHFGVRGGTFGGVVIFICIKEGSKAIVIFFCYDVKEIGVSRLLGPCSQHAATGGTQ